MSTTTALLMITVPLGVLGLLFLVTIAAVGMARRGATSQKATIMPPMREVSPELQAHALKLIHQKKMIQAIKEVRQATRMGLKDAKDYCEALRDGLIRPGSLPGSGLLSDRVRAFKDVGDRPSAVALVQAETGMSQAEAVRFVDALDD